MDTARYTSLLSTLALARLRVLSGRDVCLILCRQGFTEVRRRGSHIVMQRIVGESTITGTAGVFCRVGARRLAPEESGLLTHGPHADAALRALRNYAA